MKIFGFNITNAVKVASQPIMEKIAKFHSQIYRVRQDIGKLKSAITIAENVQNPNRYLLLQTYNDVVLDNHLSACIMQRKNLTLCRGFKVVDKAGNDNEDLTALLKSKWFRQFLNHSLDSIFWGYSLIQFNELEAFNFKSVKLVPRQYVKPEFSVVVDNWGAMEGVNYKESPYKEWCIGVGENDDLGLLMKLSFLAIWKKNAIGAWAEYQEIFGSPMRIGKTGKRDKETRQNMEAMLQNMGTAAWGLFDIDDTIELISTGQSDSFQVFDQLITRCNSEMAKLILGQTATTDEKSFVGSAEVQERILNQVGENDEYFICSVLNDQLLPMLIDLGFGFKGYKIIAIEDDELTLQDRSKIDLELLKYYDIPADYIEKLYGTPVEKKAVPIDNGIVSVQNSLSEYYK